MGNMLPTQTKTKLITYHVAIISGTCLLMSQNVLAAALFNHIVQPYVGTALTYDSNILRLPDNFTPEMSGGKTTKSSFIKQVTVGLATRWQISQQELIANVSMNQNWFSTFNELNYTGHNLLGQWNWQLGQKLKGELSYNNRLILGGFQSLNRLPTSNLQKEEHYTARGNYEILPDWYLRAGFMRDITLYPSGEGDLQQNNLFENTKEFGLRYISPLDNLLGMYLTITDGKYPLRDASSIFDNAYTRTSYNLEGRWYYSVKTRISGDIGYTSQDFQNVKSRNFSGITAHGDILWEPTRKTSVLLAAWREISIAGNLTSSFVMNQGVRLTPIWRWSETPEIQVELPISYEQRVSLGATGVTNSAAQLQTGTSTIRLNLNYKPIANVEMTAFMLYEKRNANNPLNAYQDESVGLTMKVSF